jgi:RNA polymerase sigma-70 factor, ECF subfamily
MDRVPVEGFEVWYRAEHARVVAALLAMSGDLDASLDATDEAFARALARWEKVQRMDSPGAWTTTVALNVLRRAKRRRATEQRAVDRMDRPAVAAPAPDPELWDAVRALPDRQRTAVALRYVGGYPEADVARIMKVRRGTVASTLFEARRRLAEMLDSAESPEEILGA